jgi:hypothetical protein
MLHPSLLSALVGVQQRVRPLGRKNHKVSWVAVRCIGVQMMYYFARFERAAQMPGGNCAVNIERFPRPGVPALGVASHLRPHHRHQERFGGAASLGG